MSRFFLVVIFAAALVAGPAPNGSYVATAYAVSGITASGEWTHRHVVAADPDVIPIGSRIKIRRAGRYSGEYVVADTGAKIQGRKLDIFFLQCARWHCPFVGSSLQSANIDSLR